LILLWHGTTSVFYNNSSEGNKCSMAKWASVIGLALTAVGVVIAIWVPGVGVNLPRLGNYWGTSEKVERKERALRGGTIAGTLLIVIGTLLQIYAVLIQ
jgi:hypothetical protein